MDNPETPSAAPDESEGSEENAPHIEDKPADEGQSAGDIAEDEGGEATSGGSPSGDPEKTGSDVAPEEGSKSSYVAEDD
jgi:hypothetical protein